MKKSVIAAVAVISILSVAHFVSADPTVNDDLNGDGVVNVFDVSIFMTSMNQSSNLRTDFNHDGIVDEADKVIFLANYPGYEQPALPPTVTAPIPEVAQPPQDIEIAPVSGFGGK